MVYQFPTHWTDEIAAVSTDEYYQNIQVTLIDPDLVEQTYDEDTGEYTVTAEGEIWSGQARLIGIRSGVNRLNEDTWNANTQTPIRLQFPTDPDFSPPGEWTDNGDGTFTSPEVIDNEDGTFDSGVIKDNGDGTWTFTPWLNYRLRRGIVLRVDSSPRNRSLEQMVFTCSSDLQGGAAASRTVQFALDGDAQVSSD